MSWRFKDFLAHVKGLDEQAFLARHPYALLLSEGAGGSGAATKSSPDIATPPTKKLGSLDEAAAQANDQGEAWVVPICRKEGSKLAIITVGRGEECDVRLVHPLISKKHAYFQNDGNIWHIADAESTNCTFLDGDKLEPHKLHRLLDSVVLRFGPAVKYRFFTPYSFHAYCQMRSRMREDSGKHS